MLNERLPEVHPSLSSFPTVPVPSMRRGSGENHVDTEELIRHTLEEDGDGGVVERLADRIAMGRRVPRGVRDCLISSWTWMEGSI